MSPGMDLNRFSAQITVPKSQGNAQAMLYATGIKDEAQMQLPQVGISSVWWEGNPCTSPPVLPNTDQKATCICWSWPKK
jgi:dihydroxyacid dehydratase/phosphogluconate dehydratase